MSSLRSIAFLALATGFATLSQAQVSGSGTTTRYWDCCKPSCSWPGKADVSSPVQICDKSDSPLTDANTPSACGGGSSYMCSDQSPWAVSADLAYGFAAVSLPGGTEATNCCSCYELTFTSTSIAGKKFIVQATNTGSDLGAGQFDLAIPGGGVGLFNACTDEWGAPANGWGAQYGGISSNTCSSFPSALQGGCGFRFGDFFEGADNPTIDYKEVTCPKVLTDKTGCIRAGDTPTGGDASSSVATVAAPATSSTAAATSAAAPTTTSTTAAASVYSSSSVAAPVASSSASEAAPVASSTTSSATEAAPTTSTSAPTPPAYSAPASSSSSSSSSVAAPVSASSSGSSYMSSAYSFTGTYSSAAAPYPTASSSSSEAAPIGTASPSGTAPGGQCEVQYEYVYDL